jgi:hypothetical protein
MTLQKRQRIISLCDILKMSISSNNGLLNYRYRDIDICLTDSSIFCPFVRPLLAILYSGNQDNKGLNLGLFRDFLRDIK